MLTQRLDKMDLRKIARQEAVTEEVHQDPIVQNVV